jgi:hypothetical protein
MGRTEFLLPDGVTVPERGLPPLTTRSAMEKEKGVRTKRTPWNALFDERLGKD